jgi:hypothetical protein
MAEAAGVKLGADDTVPLVTPMLHGQSWGLPQAATYRGAKIILPGRYMAEDTAVLVDEMIAEGVTAANGAPAVFEPMLAYIETLSVKPDFSIVQPSLRDRLSDEEQLDLKRCQGLPLNGVDVRIDHPKWQERPLALVVTVDGAELPIGEVHSLLLASFAKW